MEWLNLHKSVMDSALVRGADAQDRGTWLSLLSYCIGQENGGIIRSCHGWGDRLWLSIVGISKTEADRVSNLWDWRDGSLHVKFYPNDKETEVKTKREAARLGGLAHSEAKANAARRNGAMGGRKPKQNPSTNPTEGEGNGMESNGKEKEQEG